MSDEVLAYQIKTLVEGQKSLAQQQQEMHDRFDGKLDKLAEAMTYLAKHEERLTSHYENQKRLGERQDAADARMDSFDERLRQAERPTMTEAIDSAKASAKKPSNIERVGVAAAGILIGAVLMKGFGLA